MKIGGFFPCIWRKMQLQTTPQRNFSQNKNLGIKGGTVGKRKSIQISASSKNVDILLVKASKMLDFLAPPPLLLSYSPTPRVLPAARGLMFCGLWERIGALHHFSPVTMGPHHLFLTSNSNSTHNSSSSGFSEISCQSPISETSTILEKINKPLSHHVTSAPGHLFCAFKV